MGRRATDREALLRRELDRMLPLLRAHARVLKVIVFGSLATGAVRPNSDLDLVVVMRSEDRFMDRLDELYRLLCPRVALDLLAYTEEEFARLSQESRWLRRVLRHGQVIHG